MATHPCNPSIWKVEAGENCHEFEANCRGVKTLFQEAKNKLNVITMKRTILVALITDSGVLFLVL